MPTGQATPLRSAHRHLGTWPACSGQAGPGPASVLLLGVPLAGAALGSSLGAVVIYCFCSNDCSMSDYKCLLAGGPDSENSHDLLPKLMEPQMGLMSPCRHWPQFQGGWGWEEFRPDAGLREGLQEEESGGLEFQ